ncbi:MAG TPA: hypothetical protein VNU48_07025 [Burkholderiaceae bacterium]|nr:hypothetical protein [Burkholderiaceae bacterium]
MRSAAQLIVAAKAKLGDHRMSDQKFGDQTGYAQQTIAKAKRGGMSDQVAMKIAEILQIEAGEVIWVARVEREQDPTVRRHLEAWVRHVGKALASVPSKAAAFVAAVALGMFSPAHDAQAFGGAGR